MSELKPTNELVKLLDANPPRQKAVPTGTMRERLAVAIRGSQPNFFKYAPSDAYTIFLYEKPERREWLEQWADNLLRHFDVLDLELTDRNIP